MFKIISWYVILSKNFENPSGTLGVTSACFILSGKLASLHASLKSFCDVSEQPFVLYFNI